MADQVWGWFWKLEQGRQRDAGEPQAVSYIDIQAWSGLMQITLAPWEVDAFMAMDIARRGALRELVDAGGSEKDGLPKASRTVSFNSEAAERMFDGFGTVIEVDPE